MFKFNYRAGWGKAGFGGILEVGYLSICLLTMFGIDRNAQRICRQFRRLQTTI